MYEMCECVTSDEIRERESEQRERKREKEREREREREWRRTCMNMWKLGCEGGPREKDWGNLRNG
jgi:hypothetical protein